MGLPLRPDSHQRLATLSDAMCDPLLADRLLRPGGWLLADDVANKDYAAWPRRGQPQPWFAARPTAALP